MIMVENPRLQKSKSGKGDFLSFDVRILKQDTGEPLLVIFGAVLTRGYINGPSKKGGARWYPTVKMHGPFQDDVRKALNASGWRELFPTVKWSAAGKEASRLTDEQAIDKYVDENADEMCAEVN
jgi:hypothetical protein